MSAKVTMAERNALLNWQMAHGRNWRSALSAAWMSGNYGHMFAHDEARLQGLRNRLGPSWLATYRLERR